MSSIERDYPAEAILFFSNNNIAKQMLYSEFQAVLDGYVPLSELADNTIKAVYVHVDEQFCVIAAAFFTVDIDSLGFVDKRWNLPLARLMDNNAYEGPDMGSGPIQVVSAEHCHVEWCKPHLWHPRLDNKSQHLASIKKAVKQNKLGLIFNVSMPAVNGPQSLGMAELQGYNERTTQLLAKYRNRVRSLNVSHKNALAYLTAEHEKANNELKEKLNHQKQVVAELESNNKNFSDTINSQAEKIEGLREYFEHKLSAAQNDDKIELKSLKANYLGELGEQVEKATSEIKDELHMREVEILYRNEREDNLNEQILKLQKENKALLDGSSDHLLEQLSSAGITYTAYHPGAGNLTIPQMDMAEYLDNPNAYAAHRCDVSEDIYQQWLVHYHAPVCHEARDNGGICGELIARVEHPKEFVPVNSCRCNNHKQKPCAVTSIYS